MKLEELNPLSTGKYRLYFRIIVLHICELQLVNQNKIMANMDHSLLYQRRTRVTHQIDGSSHAIKYCNGHPWVRMEVKKHTWMFLEVSKRLVSGLYPQYAPFIGRLYPITNHLLAPWDIQVVCWVGKTITTGSGNIRQSKSSKYIEFIEYVVSKLLGCFMELTLLNLLATAPENRSPAPNGNVIFQPLIFRGFYS